MAQFYISRNACSIEQLVGSDPDAVQAFCRYNQVPTNGLLLPATPYCLDPPDQMTPALLCSINALPLKSRLQLAQCVEQHGQQSMALAMFHNRHLANLDLQDTGGLVGAGASALHTRATGFQRALRHYQAALIALNDSPRRGRSSGAERARLQRNVTDSFQVLNQQYRVEMNRFVQVADIGKNRGSALTSAERGITLASRRPSKGLYVANTIQAGFLSLFSRSMTVLGGGAVLLDAGLRMRRVRGIARDGGNWQREASIQATAFGVAGGVGLAAGKSSVMLAGKAATIGLGSIGLTLTPVGWAVIIGVGITAGFGAAYYADKGGNAFASFIWSRGR